MKFTVGSAMVATTFLSAANAAFPSIPNIPETCLEIPQVIGNKPLQLLSYFHKEVCEKNCTATINQHNQYLQESVFPQIMKDLDQKLDIPASEQASFQKIQTQITSAIEKDCKSEGDKPLCNDLEGLANYGICALKASQPIIMNNIGQLQGSVNITDADCTKIKQIDSDATVWQKTLPGLGRADTCVPSPRPAAQRPTANTRISDNSNVTYDSGRRPTTTLGANTLAGRADSASFEASEPSRSTVDTQPMSPETLHRTHPRMLRNLRGERVYVGKAASLSFLQLVRDTVSQYIGPSQFSHNVKSEDMLETETPHGTPPTLESSLDSYQLLQYYQTYSSATSGFIYVLSGAEAMEILDALIEPSTHPDRTEMAVADMIIAIGAQASKRTVSTEQAERYFFSRAQRSAFEGMLENPSLPLIRLFLLMSFYMLGACRRNAAFMYLGVAVRAAVALGLHLTELADAVPNPEQHQRARVWMSVYNLDLLVSSILGRPAATAALRSETDDGPIRYTLLEGHMSMGLVASYGVSRILEEIISSMYSKEGASADLAESLLAKLKQWSDELPGPLVEPPNLDFDEPAARTHIINNLHVACIYHFAVITATRPFLVSVLGVRLARLHNDSTDGASSDLLHEEAAHSNLATACIDSALYMIQTCSEVHRSGLMLGNMCILKAFVFAAALVLGFSMFSRKEAEPSHERAYGEALEILRVLSEQSAQAAHYYEILSCLGNAVTEQRRRLEQHSRQIKGRYVSKLFSLDDRRPSVEVQRGLDTPLLNSVSAISPEAGISDPWAGIQRLGFMDSLGIDAAFTGLDGMQLPVWDSFPFVGEAFQLQGRVGDVT
ncbi:transcriptional regulator family: Fungal Specific TF [Aspergillus niger]|nr:transcriptional regulator family: Fungal Specific TF [Aspergillus niger]KAI2856087.1 transcriptional regulator family: Fungal Specific TF [Aspergillus niger]KAI2857827.1 transcriptional regulator family: Fungal Specific TF [Aspergillus niger]KAI2876531.1 transcriptional regulator family: Fungal Specific TF [Aspergillus niger]KAI2909134.1 transcriptional regulator family: Fungal Specific TF [Aspergillus niger]